MGFVRIAAEVALTVTLQPGVHPLCVCQLIESGCMRHLISLCHWCRWWPRIQSHVDKFKAQHANHCTAIPSASIKPLGTWRVSEVGAAVSVEWLEAVGLRAFPLSALLNLNFTVFSFYLVRATELRSSLFRSDLAPNDSSTKLVIIT